LPSFDDFCSHFRMRQKWPEENILALCKKLKGYRKLIKIKTVATQVYTVNETDIRQAVNIGLSIIQGKLIFFINSLFLPRKVLVKRENANIFFSFSQ